MGVDAEAGGHRLRWRVTATVVLITVLPIVACGSGTEDSEPDAESNSAKPSVSYEVRSEYQPPVCMLQGPPLSTVVLKDGLPQAVDVGADGEIDGIRSGEDLLIRGPAVDSWMPPGKSWIRLPADPEDPKTALFRQSSLASDFVWLFPFEDPVQTVAGFTSKGRASPVVRNLPDGSRVTIAWTSKDDEVGEVRMSSNPPEIGFSAKTTFTVLGEGSVPAGPAASDIVGIDSLAAKPLVQSNPRLDEACAQMTPEEIAALQACVDQLPADLTVRRWLIGRSTTDAMNPPECGI